MDGLNISIDVLCGGGVSVGVLSPPQSIFSPGIPVAGVEFPLDKRLVQSPSPRAPKQGMPGLKIGPTRSWLDGNSEKASCNAPERS